MSDTKVIDYFSLGHPLANLRSYFAWRAREVMLERFMMAFQIGPDSKVLDIGVTPDMSLSESNHFEQRFLYPHNLTAISIEDVSGLRERFPEVTFMQISKGRLPFDDRQFDAVFCSAVIEHVGTRSQQAAFLAEVARVGKGFMLTTPNRWFPLDFHTILPLVHWFPQPVHQKILRVLGKNFWAQTSNLNLMSKADFMSIQPKDTELTVDYVKLLGWPSNLIASGRHLLSS